MNRRHLSLFYNNSVELATSLLALFMAIMCTTQAHTQTVQPVIQEYTEKADGKLELTNDTLTPMAVVLEAKSFSISSDGRGIYRALDRNIHVQLSTTSIRLEPKQTYYVFYKANAQALPAWFTIYASFSAINSNDGIKVRVMLPHTVYLYQKRPINKETIHVSEAAYVAGNDTVVCDLTNTGSALVRVQEVRAFVGKTTVSAAGFPLLPGSSRHLSFDWKEKGHPEYLLLHFPHFDVKEPLTAKDQ